MTFNQEAKGDVGVLKTEGPTLVRHEKNFQNEGRRKVPGWSLHSRSREQHFQTRWWKKYPEKIYRFKTKINRYLMYLMILKEVLCLSWRLFIWDILMIHIWKRKRWELHKYKLPGGKGCTSKKIIAIYCMTQLRTIRILATRQIPNKWFSQQLW